MDSSKGAMKLEQYDPRKNQWAPVAPMASRRLQFGVANLSGDLFIVGGRDGLRTLNTVESYIQKTNRWIPMPTMSTHRHGLGVAVLHGPLYAVGGHDGWSYLSTVERYCIFFKWTCHKLIKFCTHPNWTSHIILLKPRFFIHYFHDPTKFHLLQSCILLALECF